MKVEAQYQQWDSKLVLAKGVFTPSSRGKLWFILRSRRQFCHPRPLQPKKCHRLKKQSKTVKCCHPTCLHTPPEKKSWKTMLFLLGWLKYQGLQMLNFQGVYKKATFLNKLVDEEGLIGHELFLNFG